MESCPFCEIEVLGERVIGEIGGCRVIVSLGQVMTRGGYLLVTPARHAACLGALRPLELPRFVAVVVTALRIMMPVYGSQITVFEHGVVGQSVFHAHLHLVPRHIEFGPRVRADFPGCEIQTLRGFEELVELYGARPRPYLLWQAPGEELTVCWDPPDVHQGYLRKAAADLLEVPDLGAWQNVDPVADAALVDETIEKLYLWFAIG
jgi:diadenosine tetraphosphate (Ap4A) HIT family hydrolase